MTQSILQGAVPQPGRDRQRHLTAPRDKLYPWRKPIFRLIVRWAVTRKTLDWRNTYFSTRRPKDELICLHRIFYNFNTWIFCIQYIDAIDYTVISIWTLKEAMKLTFWKFQKLFFCKVYCKIYIFNDIYAW